MVRRSQIPHFLMTFNTLVLLALFYVGARRLEHLRSLSGDPLVTRFCGLARLPTRRTVADWLRQFTQETLAPLVALNRDLVTEALTRLALPRAPVEQLTRLFELARFSDHPLVSGELDGARTCLEEIRVALEIEGGARVGR